MPSTPYTIALAALLAAPSLATAPALAQPADTNVADDTIDAQGDATPSSDLLPPNFPIISYSANAAIAVRTEADVDNTDNGYSVRSSGGSLGVAIIPNRQLVFNIDASIEYAFYEFDGAQPLIASIPGSTEPFEDAQTYALGLTTIIRTSEETSILLGGSISASYEGGADFDDAIGGIAFAGITHAFSETLTLGVSAAIIFDLDGQPNVIPLPFVEWQITDTLSLNSSQRGLELTWNRTDTLDLGLRLGFDGREFRLADDGPIPGGIAEDQAVLLTGVIDWRPESWLELRLEAGAQVWGNLELRNSNDVRIYDESLGSAFTAGASVKVTF